MGRPAALKFTIALVFLLALLTPLRRQLFIGDETKYSEVVREMRSTGQWFLPQLESVPFTHKPPLHFWAIALLTIPLGTYSIWPYVLPSLISFAALLILMWRRAGPLPTFVCATSLLVWGSAQSARMDVAFTLLIAIAAWDIERFFESDDRWALLRCGIALGIATLVKGPMAPVIVLVLFGLEAWRRRRLPRGPYLPALLATAIIPLAWFVPAMRLGGSWYAHEVLQKQLAGRAVASWVHASPPWFYLLHSPGYLFPWFFAAVAAIAYRWREERFNINWILAVLVPYSLMSSKLDVYMMALIPPVAAIVGRAAEERWVRWGNMATIFILAIAPAAAMLLIPRKLTGPALSVAIAPGVNNLLIFGVAAACLAFLWSLAGGARPTLALGMVPVALIAFLALTLMPAVNSIASSEPIVRVLERQSVPPDRIVLYYSPHLWARDMPRRLENVRYASPVSVELSRARVIVTARNHENEISAQLAGMRHVEYLWLIGKWFDVYRR